MKVSVSNTVESYSIKCDNYSVVLYDIIVGNVKQVRELPVNQNM